MRNVALPDSTYAEAARAAEAKGQSVDEFVLETIQDRLGEEAPLVLTPEQTAVVRRAQEDVRAGRIFTPEQIRADLDEFRAGWSEANAS